MLFEVMELVEMKIRNFLEQDKETCVVIANEAFEDEIQRGMPVFTEEYFIKRGVMNGVKLVVAYEERVIGFMLLTDAKVQVPAQLHLVAMDKQYRGKGIGKKLVQYAVDYTLENGWVKLKLSTRPWNKAMRKICSDLGFNEEVLLRKEYLGEDLIQYGYFPSKNIDK